MSKALELPELSKKISLKRTGTSYNERRVSSDNHLQNM